MKNSFDTIIVGAGVGGLAIGALLANSGRKVLVLEKNNQIGGRCMSYKYKGFTLDLGNHLFSLGDRGPIGEVCRMGGMPDAIEWVLAKTSTIQIGDTVKKYNRKAMMEVLPEGERANMERIFLQAAQTTDDQIDDLWYVPLDKWLEQFTSNPMAHALVESISTQYFCIPLNETSAGEFVRCFRDTILSKSSAYPKGGCISIPKGFAAIVEKNNGEIRLKTRVKKIVIERGAATGVVTSDGETLHAPVIISNADIKSSLNDLVGEEFFPSDYTEKINRLTYAYQSVMLKVGLEEKVTDDQLRMYMPEKFSPILKITEGMHAGIIPNLVGGMIVSPTNYDPELAPAGQQLISFGTACTMQPDWRRWREVMLDSFFKAYPQSRGKTLWTKLDTPKIVAAYAGEEGNIIGVGQTTEQIHEKRPGVESPLKGLYFSSAEAGGHGIGVELAVSSAIELFAKLS